MSGYPAPGLGRVGLEIPLYVLPQVSNDLDGLDVYSTDKNRQNEPLAGPFHQGFDPPSQAGQNRKNRDFPRTLRAIVSPFGGGI